MTNGEKFKEVFKISQVDDCDLNVYVWLPIHDAIEIPLEWWNEEYEEPAAKIDCDNTDCNNCVNHKYCDYEPTTENDCEHCAKTYGTLGCCDYVNNEPVYSCKEGHEEYARGIRKFDLTTKNDSAHNLCDSCTNIRCEFQSGIVRTKCAFYMPPQHSTDCISRANAIQAMQNKAKKITNEDTINGLCGAVAILFDLPSVTPIRPKGHWIVEKGSYLGMRTACCGNCKDFYTHNWNVMNYCPNCGADMREVEE